MADYVYPRFTTSFPGLFPLKLGGAGKDLFSHLGNEVARFSGIPMECGVECV